MRPRPCGGPPALPALHAPYGPAPPRVARGTTASEPTHAPTPLRSRRQSPRAAAPRRRGQPRG
eukprot:4226102-Prymnesium_polylepis.1